VEQVVEAQLVVVVELVGIAQAQELLAAVLVPNLLLVQSQELTTQLQ
jgi:hypothetical protein